MENSPQVLGNSKAIWRIRVQLKTSWTRLSVQTGARPSCTRRRPPPSKTINIINAKQDFFIDLPQLERIDFRNARAFNPRLGTARDPPEPISGIEAAKPTGLPTSPVPIGKSPRDRPTRCRKPRAGPI